MVGNRWDFWCCVAMILLSTRWLMRWLDPGTFHRSPSKHCFSHWYWQILDDFGLVFFIFWENPHIYIATKYGSRRQVPIPSPCPLPLAGGATTPGSDFLGSRPSWLKTLSLPSPITIPNKLGSILSLYSDLSREFSMAHIICPQYKISNPFHQKRCVLSIVFFFFA